MSDTNDVERAIEGFLAGDGTATDTYEHLDQFGRIGDLHWRDGSGVTQYRAEYAYDAIGNRIEASVTRRNSSQAAVVDTWSWDYGFDALQRLIDADADEDDGLGGRTSLATHAWKMDTLGNWAGDGMVDAVRALPFVRWVGAYHPAYKLNDPELQRLTIGSDAPVYQRYSIQTLRRGNGSLDGLAQMVRQMGAPVDLESHPVGRLEAWLTDDQVLAVAQRSDVLFMI